MSSIDVFLFSSAPSGPQKTLILGFDSDFFHILPPHSQSSHRQNSCISLGVSGISNLVMCAKRVILSLSNQFPSLELHNREQNGRVDDLSASKALLSCSPFVQLLQELRTRKVPKSSSLNLTCLVVQVQRTKMQVFLRLVGLLALPCLKAFFKFLLQMYELGSWAGQGYEYQSS
ncbi:hypothetical protein CerSpe_182400 [Prunus speciosa]